MLSTGVKVGSPQEHRKKKTGSRKKRFTVLFILYVFSAILTPSIKHTPQKKLYTTKSNPPKKYPDWRKGQRGTLSTPKSRLGMPGFFVEYQFLAAPAKKETFRVP
jgi:hypothetical protein